MTRRRSAILGLALFIIAAVLFVSAFYPFNPNPSPDNNSTRVERRTLSMTFLNRTFTTFSFNGSTASFPGLEYYEVRIKSTTPTSGFVNITSTPEGVWAKLFPAQSVQVDPPGISLTMAIAGGVEPGTSKTKPLSIAVNFSDGSSVQGQLTLTPVVGVSVTNGSTPIRFYITPTLMSNSTVFVPFGAVYEPPTTTAPAELPLSLEVMGLSVNGSTVALPPWLQLEFLNSSFVLSSDIPSYSEIGFICSSAPPGTYDVTILEHFPSMDLIASASIVVVPQARI